ncbi:MAG: alpha-E domain-containing protein [Verrucomicrobia bacterium]|nr:alpha-E domain-containing protein [Verrucomicrobiota bacterium]MBV8375627.1 alpha-E domain-containing protein [Verrucomicrobiota bacterium]
MLSRVADALFWLSRYTERAENNARMMDVNLQVMLDVQPFANNQQHWESIIFTLEDTKLFYKLYPEITRDAVVDFVTFERKNPNSIYSCLALARENARTVREELSVEMWEQINRMYLFFSSGDAKPMFQSSTYEFFKWILEGSHLFQGVTDATMLHDEGWEFIRLGMFLERADRTSRILDIKYHILLPSGEQIGGNVDTVQWMAVLKSCSALEPYRKHYRGQVLPWKVVEFLVKNQTFPRSIVFCVDSLDYSLHKITGVDRGEFQYSVEAERLSGKLLADLCFVTVDEIFRAGLHEYLDRMQGRLIEITKAIYKEFCEWLEEEENEPEEIEPTQFQTQKNSS